MSLQTITISNTHLNQQTNRGSFYIQTSKPKDEVDKRPGAIIFLLASMVCPIIAMAIEIPRIPEWRDYSEYPCVVVNRTQTAIEFGYYESPETSQFCSFDSVTPCNVLIANQQTGPCCSIRRSCGGSGRRRRRCKNYLSSVEYRNAWIGNLTCAIEDVNIPSKFVKCDPFDDECFKFWFQTDTFTGCQYSNGTYASYDRCEKPKNLTISGIAMIVLSCLISPNLMFIGIMTFREHNLKK